MSAVSKAFCGKNVMVERRRVDFKVSIKADIAIFLSYSIAVIPRLGVR